MSFSIRLDDEAFALDSTNAEASITSFNEQIAELLKTIDASRVEFTGFIAKAADYDHEAVGLENGMADAMRNGIDVDRVSLKAASARSKARAARQTAENIKNEITRLEANLQIRQTGLGSAEQNRAGIVFRSKAQEYARAIVALRPLVEELRELGMLARMPWRDGMGLLPDYASPEIAGIRFDI
jgi:chromosome segregation ATPase